jgi:uncharacterized membrane protein
MGFAYKKRYILISVILILLIVLVPIGLYFYTFTAPAAKTQDFANFGSYFGGVVSPVLTFFTLIVLIISLTDQQRGITQASIDNRNNLLLPKSFEAFEFSYKEIFEYLDNHTSGGIQIAVNSGKSEEAPQVSIYRLFYDPEQIPRYLESAPAFGNGTINRNINFCINEFSRFATIEESIVDMGVPYYCIERKVRDVYSRYKCMYKLLVKYADEKQSDLIQELNSQYQRIENRLKVLEPAEIKRSFDFG